jgi:hypothetical protein
MEQRQSTKEFSPSKWRYFVSQLWPAAIGSLLACALISIWTSRFPFDWFLILVSLEALVTCIEIRWMQEDLAIVISDAYISGPSASGLRWRGVRWKRVGFPLEKIDKQRIQDRGLLQSMFRQRSIWSAGKERILLSPAFDKAQIGAILEQIGCSQALPK